MKILVLTPRFPYPPVRGDTLRSWAEIEHLAREHEVWLASFDTERPAPAAVAHVRGIVRELAVAVRAKPWSLARGALGLLAGTSLTRSFHLDARLAATVRGWSDEQGFDGLLTFSSAMAAYAQLVGAHCRILDLVDVDSAKYGRYAREAGPLAGALYRCEQRQLAQLEQAAVAGHDRTLVVNHRERAKLAGLLLNGDAAFRPALDVLRTTIDLGRYGTLAVRNARKLPKAPRVGLLGSMFYPPNADAAEWLACEVWPRVRAAIPDAELVLAGAGPTRRVQRLAKRSGVVVSGFVADDLALLGTLRVYVNAVRGDLGVQSKQLCALAAGLPSVVTPDVASGIHDEPQRPFLVADSPRDFAAAVISLLQSDDVAMRMSVRGRQYVERYYDADLELGKLTRWLTGTSVGVVSGGARRRRQSDGPALQHV